MTRQEYMQQLAALLAAMPEAERRDALDYYEEYFDAVGPEKEAQTIQELGSPGMWRKRYGRVPGHSSARRCRITACQNRAAGAEKARCGLCWLSLQF